MAALALDAFGYRAMARSAVGRQEGRAGCGRASSGPRRRLLADRRDGPRHRPPPPAPLPITSPLPSSGARLPRLVLPEFACRRSGVDLSAPVAEACSWTLSQGSASLSIVSLLQERASDRRRSSTIRHRPFTVCSGWCVSRSTRNAGYVACLSEVSTSRPRWCQCMVLAGALAPIPFGKNFATPLR